jgi:hypothetical protein
MVAIVPLPPDAGLTDFTLGRNENWSVSDMMLFLPLSVTTISQVCDTGGEATCGTIVVIVVSFTTMKEG